MAGFVYQAIEDESPPAQPQPQPPSGRRVYQAIEDDLPPNQQAPFELGPPQLPSQRQVYQAVEETEPTENFKTATKMSAAMVKPLSAIKNVVDATFGGAKRGFEEAGGAQDLGFGPATKEFLQKIGVYPRPGGAIEPVKALNQAVMAPAAMGLDLGLRGIYASFTGTFDGLYQTLLELGVSETQSKKGARDALALFDSTIHAIPAVTGAGAQAFAKPKSAPKGATPAATIPPDIPALKENLTLANKAYRDASAAERQVAREVEVKVAALKERGADPLAIRGAQGELEIHRLATRNSDRAVQEAEAALRNPKPTPIGAPGGAFKPDPALTARAIAKAKFSRRLDDILEVLPEEQRGAARQAIVTDLEAAIPAEFDAAKSLLTAKAKLGGQSYGTMATEGRYTATDLQIFDMLDRLRPLEKLQRGDFGEVPSHLAPYREMRLLARVKGPLEAMQKYGTLKWTERGLEFSGAGLNKVFKPVVDDLEDAMAYFAGRRADFVRRTKPGFETGFDDNEIRSLLSLEQKNPKFREVFAEYQELDKRILAFDVQSGLLTPESARAMLGRDHVPMWRNVVEVDGILEPPHGGLFKRLSDKGSKAGYKAVMENIIRNKNMQVARGIQNVARLHIFDSIRALGKQGEWIATRMSNTPEVGLLADKRALENMQKLGVDLGNKKMEEGLVAVFTPMRPVGQGIEVVYRKGVAEYWQIHDGPMFDAINAYAPKDFGKIIRLMSGASNVLRTGVVLTPDFAIFNAMRDLQAIFIQSEANSIPVFAQGRGLVSQIVSSDNHRLMLANQGGFATLHKSEQLIAEDMQAFLTSQNLGQHTFVNTPRKAVEVLEKVMSSMELAGRDEEFRLLSRKFEGAPDSLRNASLGSSDVATDFAMRGNLKDVQAMAMVVPFLNPRVQGIWKGVRTFDKNAVRTAIKAGTAITLPTLALLHMNKDNPYYWALREDIRDLNWAIAKPGSLGKDFYLFPKGFEWGAFFGSFVERSLEFISERNGKRFAESIMRIGFDQLSLNPVPQALKPLLMGGVPFGNFFEGLNKTFSGGDIVPRDLAGVVKPHLEARPYTSVFLTEVANNLSEDMGVEMSPMRTDAFIRGTFGTWGTYNLMVADELTRAFGDYGDAPERGLDEYPVMRRMLKTWPFRGTQVEGDFYEMYGEAKMVAATIKALQGEGRLEEMNRELAKHEGVNAILQSMVSSPKIQTFQQPFLAVVAARNTVMSKMIRNIQRDKKMDGAAKKKAIDKIQAERNEMFMQVNRGTPEAVMKHFGFKRLPPERAK